MYLFYDLHQLWATGRVASLGGNPYDSAQVNQQLQLLGFPYLEQSGGTFYPPWAFWLLGGLGALPFSTVRWIWGILSAVCLLYAAKRTMKLAAGRYTEPLSLSPPLAALVIVAFLPLVKTYLWGQPVAVPFLGLTLFLSLHSAGRSRFLSGLLLSLAFVKPHLFIPLFCYLAVRAFKDRSYPVLVGLTVGFAVQLLGSAIIYPAAITQFADRLERLRDPGAPLLIQSTLGHLGYILTGSPLLIATSPLLAAAAGIGAALRPHSDPLLRMGGLAALGACLTPYAWAHDHVLALFPYLALVLGARSLGAALGSVVAQCLVSWAVFSALGVRGEVFLVWLPGAILILWWGAAQNISQPLPDASRTNT